MIEPGPHSLDEHRPVLQADGSADLRSITPDFYEKLAHDYASFKGHVLVQRFEFSEAWPTWEVHPEGDEFVYLLEGDTDFLLLVDGQQKVVRVERSGDFVIVPKGIWHTARPRTKTSMLFITPGEGTENAEQPPGL